MEASIAVDALGKKILVELQKELQVTGVKANATYQLTTHELSQREQRGKFFLELETKLKEKPGELVEAEERPVVLENWNSSQWQATKRSLYPQKLWRALLTEAQLEEAKVLARILTRTYRVSGFDSGTSMPLCDLLKIACFLPQYDLKEENGLEEFQAGVKAIPFRKGSKYFDQAVKVWTNAIDSVTKSTHSAADLRKRFCHIFVATQWLKRNGTFRPQNA
jgi:hypothetical protein